MRKETKKKLKNLEKHLKTCPDCGKEFLGISCNDTQKHLSISIYPLRCNKCPECAMKCYEKDNGFVDDNNELKDECFSPDTDGLECIILSNEDWQFNFGLFDLLDLF